MGWACNQCGMMFFISIEEVTCDGIARHVTTAFSSHFCAAQQLSIHQAADPEMIDIAQWPRDPRPADTEPGRE